MINRKNEEKFVAEIQKKFENPGYNEEFREASQFTLNILCRDIENYKISNGTYPDNLNQIGDPYLIQLDLSFNVIGESGETQSASYYYEKLDNKFWLSGVGRDGVSKTEDDLIPQIFKYEEKNTGLLKYEIKPLTERDIKKGVIELNGIKKP